MDVLQDLNPSSSEILWTATPNLYCFFGFFHPSSEFFLSRSQGGC